MLENIGIMNKKFEEEFLVWILEDDELQQSKKIKATSNLKRAINKLQASIEEHKKYMHPLDRLLSMPSIMDDYNSKIDAISNIKARLEDSMELVSYLHKTKTYEFYRLIIDYVENHLTPISLSNNEDDIAFFIVKSELASIMKRKGIAGSTRINLKLNSLCELGLLSKLHDNQIREDALSKAYEIRDILSKNINSKVHRINFYILNPLTESTVSEALRRIELIKTSGIRQRGICADTRCCLFGVDTVNENMVVQKQVNIDDKVLNRFISAANELLDTNRYFTSDELRKAYCKRDKHIKKSAAITLTKKYLPGVVNRIGAIETRVNKHIRNDYNLPNKIKSNSYIFIRKNISV